ncbi:MAG: hypothetical protein LC099_01950 [Anaerolineales bacterium]|nr:hypothetical protein [Anaerolineales bacterium]
MKTVQRFIGAVALAALCSLSFTPSALAFDGRSGDQVVVAAGEVVNDDLYVSAREFTLDGVVKGDLVVVGEYVVINGTVEGDLIAAGNTVVVNGTVKDDARIAGAALQIGDKASIGGDLVAAGASLEVKAGGEIGQDALFGGGQALLAGDIQRNLSVGAGALEIDGKIGGNVRAEVGETQEGSVSPTMYFQDVKISTPNVQSGLTINDGAKIGGDLTYTQSKDVEISETVVAGKTTRKTPTENARPAPHKAKAAANWTFDLLRKIATLFLLGLLLVWLAPNFLKNLRAKIQSQPLPSLGWGVVAYIAFFVILFFIVVAIIVGGIFFGVMTLGSMVGVIVGTGSLSIFALSLGFALFVGFGAQILAAQIGGKWIFERLHSPLADHKIWSLLLGAIVVGLLVKLPFVGWLAGVLIAFFGLGAFWLWMREKKQTPAVVTVA